MQSRADEAFAIAGYCERTSLTRAVVRASGLPAARCLHRLRAKLIA
jgi:hypothetical protein